jgi:predicted outer membrane lipoprotein
MLSLSTTAPPYLLVSPNSLPKLSPHFLSSFMTNSRREEKEYRKKKLVFRFCCGEVGCDIFFLVRYFSCIFPVYLGCAFALFNEFRFTYQRKRKVGCGTLLALENMLSQPEGCLLLPSGSDLSSPIECNSKF